MDFKIESEIDMKDDQKFNKKIDVVRKVMNIIHHEMNSRTSFMPGEDQHNIFISILINSTIEYFKDNFKKEYFMKNIEKFCWQLQEAAKTTIVH